MNSVSPAVINREMTGKDSVIVHGMWASPFSKRVELALKVKGIPYEYVEEDFKKKTPELLKYNPVHKKIPVLVHNGKPIAESLVILEYIEEAFKDCPQLLPSDPYEKSQVRFWVDFVHTKFSDIMMTVIKTKGEEQEKALCQVYELLKVLDEGIKIFFPDGNPSFEAKHLGLLDIVASSVLCPFRASEEVLGIKIIDPEKTPLLNAWITALSELPQVLETLPAHGKLVSILGPWRQSFINPPASSS
ncbi:PREDICTED: glutathione S-transferase U9-like [Fragaria vesca subsp. vesca]|uniref:glutathione S-transferase U9-like n=1 Tax=Fragaria vesca subsp. vesca TaxID=101020 RepID=UPI0002C30ED4|nr:PREDICTED: glutathione S-transferase U9-like [Fragaria vesca subsp. vesca]